MRLEERMKVYEFEKSLDNRCAALVSRERRAPRAVDERKSFVYQRLGSTHSTQTARGAQVSRAARDPNALFSRPACRALLPFAASQAR